jgi:hypothetical protein
MLRLIIYPSTQTWYQGSVYARRRVINGRRFEVLYICTVLALVVAAYLLEKRDA